MAADEVRPCVLDEGTFSEDSFYYLLMGHGSRRERVLFAMCQLVQILFLFIIVVPAFATDLSKGYLDIVSMDDDQERLALFPDVPGYPKSAMDDGEKKALDGWADAFVDLIPQMTIFTIFAVWSEYSANLIPEKSALFQMNGKVAGPRFFAELGMAFIIGTGGGYMFYSLCFDDDFWGYVDMPLFAFVPLVPWLGVMALSMAPSDSARSVTFIKLASITGMINDLMIAWFSTFLAIRFPHIAFAISLGLVIVASLDEWIYTWAQNLSTAAGVSKQLVRAAEEQLAQGEMAAGNVHRKASGLASGGLKGIGAVSATVAPTIMATDSPNPASAAAAGDDHGGPENA